MKLISLSLVILGWMADSILSNSLPIERPAGQSGIGGFTYSVYTKHGCKSPQVIDSELKHLASLTKHIRLYSADCNQLENVISSIKKNKLALQVLSGIWTKDGSQKMNADINTFIKVYSQHENQSIISGLVIGNEDIKNNASVSQVIANINTVKQQLSSKGLKVSIGYAEIGDLFAKNPDLVKNVDVVYANLYSFFDSPNPKVSMSEAAQKVIGQYETLRKTLGKKVVISECGWPSFAQGGYLAAGSVENQAKFIESFICRANKLGISYYLLEPYDSIWKSRFDNPNQIQNDPSPEPHFGLMLDNGAFKHKSFNPNSQC